MVDDMHGVPHMPLGSSYRPQLLYRVAEMLLILLCVCVSAGANIPRSFFWFSPSPLVAPG